MEKLVHKSSGELVPDDPFKILGAKIAYDGGDRRPVIGVVTKAALAKYGDPEWQDLNKRVNAVWADWHPVGYMPRDKVWIVE